MKFQHSAFGETFNCVAVPVRYADGSTALQILDQEDGMPFAMASVNLGDEVDTPEEHVWLKTWSENAGIEQSLERAGIVELVDRMFPVNAHGDVAILAKLSPTLLDKSQVATD